MNIAQMMLPEFDDEMGRTRLVLQAVPADKLKWKAGENVNDLGWNANHLADIVSWTPTILQQPEFDMSPPGGEPFHNPTLTDPQQILNHFDRAVAEARHVLANSSDEVFAENWTMKMAGETLFTLPKGACFRTWVMNHSIHHRAILSVYLRLAGVELTPVYDG